MREVGVESFESERGTRVCQCYLGAWDRLRMRTRGLLGPGRYPDMVTSCAFYYHQRRCSHCDTAYRDTWCGSVSVFISLSTHTHLLISLLSLGYTSMSPPSLFILTFFCLLRCLLFHPCRQLLSLLGTVQTRQRLLLSMPACHCLPINLVRNVKMLGRTSRGLSNLCSIGF